MTFSEISLLKLKSPFSLDDEDLCTRLTSIKAALADITGHPFYYLQSIHDSSSIYLLGEWQSLEQHYKGVQGRPDFKENLKDMMKFFDFQWMAHYDFTMDDLHIVSTDAACLEVALFSVDKSKRESAAAATKSSINAVQAMLSPGEAVVGGWRHEDGDQDQFAIEILRHASNGSSREALKVLEDISDKVTYDSLKIQTQI